MIYHEIDYHEIAIKIEIPLKLLWFASNKFKNIIFENTKMF